MGIGEALSLACALNWAFVLLLFRRAGRSVAPFALNLTKNCVAFALFLPTIALWHGTGLPDITARDVAMLLASGFLGIAVGDTLVFRSLNLLGAGLMAIVECLYSPFVVLLSIVWLGETLTAAQALGCALVLAALVLVSATERIEHVPRGQLFRGVALGAVALLLMAIGVVMTKPVLDRAPLLWTIEIRYFAGVFGMLVFVPFMKGGWRRAVPGPMPRGEWAAVIGSAVLGAYFQIILWMAGMKHTQASVAAVLNQMATIFTILLAWLVLREPLTRFRVAGAAIAIAGALLITLG